MALLLLARQASMFAPMYAAAAQAVDDDESRPSNCTLVHDVDLAGPNVFEPGQRGVASPGACCTLCQSYGNCSGFTWMDDAPPYDNYCSLKVARINHTGHRSVGHVSGLRDGRIYLFHRHQDLRGSKQPMGIFMKASWASEVSQAQLDAGSGWSEAGRWGHSHPTMCLSSGSAGRLRRYWPCLPCRTSSWYSYAEGDFTAVQIPTYSTSLRRDNGHKLFEETAVAWPVQTMRRCNNVATDFSALPTVEVSNLASFLLKRGCLENPAVCPSCYSSVLPFGQLPYQCCGRLDFAGSLKRCRKTALGTQLAKTVVLLTCRHRLQFTIRISVDKQPPLSSRSTTSTTVR